MRENRSQQRSVGLIPRTYGEYKYDCHSYSRLAVTLKLSAPQVSATGGRVRGGRFTPISRRCGQALTEHQDRRKLGHRAGDGECNQTNQAGVRDLHTEYAIDSYQPTGCYGREHGGRQT